MSPSSLIQSPFAHSHPEPPLPGPPSPLSVATPGQPGAIQRTPSVPGNLPTSVGRGEGLLITEEAALLPFLLGFRNLSGRPCSL